MDLAYVHIHNVMHRISQTIQGLLRSFIKRQQSVFKAESVEEALLIEKQKLLVEERFRLAKRRIVASYDQYCPTVPFLISESPKRMYLDNVSSEHASRLLISALDEASTRLGFQGPEVALNPLTFEAQQIIGIKPYAIVNSYVEQVKMVIRKEFLQRDARLTLAGSMLTRLQPTDQNLHRGYSSPHVDKANRFTYDISTVLYLNDSIADRGEHEANDGFGKGRFFFNDIEGDIAIIPRRGRLLIFESGTANLHRIEEVASGSRYTLALWFHFPS